jgi:hypothetical protein
MQNHSKPLHRVFIYDDPESKINFLETTLKDKEWEAVIYDPSPAGKSRLPEIEKTLKGSSYKLVRGQDANGIGTLTIHHFSHETGLLRAFRELGLTKGLEHTMETAGERLGDVMQRGKKLLQFWTSSEARRFSFAYVFGDVYLTLARGFDHSFKNPSDKVYSAGYLLALAQSVIMMNFAKEGKEILAEEIEHGMQQAVKKGLNLENFEEWADEVIDRRNPLTKMLNRHALKIGAASQMAGQALVATSGVLELRENSKLAKGYTDDVMKQAQRRDQVGAVSNFLTGALSTYGWYLIGWGKEKDVGEKVPWGENSLKRLSQEFQETPEKLASVLVTLASVIGLAGGKFKHNVTDELKHRDKRENVLLSITNPNGLEGPVDENFLKQAQAARDEIVPVNRPPSKGSPSQVAGNVAYLIGDATVYLSRGSNYTKGQINNAEVMAEVAEMFISRLPLIMGAPEKEKFITQLSTYLARKQEEIIGQGNATDPLADIPQGERTFRRASEIKDSILNRLPGDTLGLGPLMMRAADVAVIFPEEKRAEVVEALSHSLSTLPAIAVKKEDIAHRLTTSLARKQRPLRSQLVQMKDVQQALSQLVLCIPGGRDADNALALHQALQPFLSRSVDKEKDQQTLERMIQHDAEQLQRAATLPHYRTPDPSGASPTLA